jgi:hypothetical protein
LSVGWSLQFEERVRAGLIRLMRSDCGRINDIRGDEVAVPFHNLVDGSRLNEPSRGKRTLDSARQLVGLRRQLPDFRRELIDAALRLW